MEKEELKLQLHYLVNKYIGDEFVKEQLKSYIDNSKAKYVLAEVDKNKIINYSESDKELIKDIAFFFC